MVASGMNPWTNQDVHTMEIAMQVTWAWQMTTAATVKAPELQQWLHLHGLPGHGLQLYHIQLTLLQFQKLQLQLRALEALLVG